MAADRRDPDFCHTVVQPDANAMRRNIGVVMQSLPDRIAGIALAPLMQPAALAVAADSELGVGLAREYIEVERPVSDTVSSIALG